MPDDCRTSWLAQDGASSTGFSIADIGRWGSEGQAMTKCDCCGRDTEQTYRVELALTAADDNRLAHAIWQLWCKYNVSNAGWICPNCEYMLRIMASIGWFEMSMVEATVSNGTRHISSLAMWQ